MAYIKDQNSIQLLRPIRPRMKTIRKIRIHLIICEEKGRLTEFENWLVSVTKAGLTSWPIAPPRGLDKLARAFADTRDFLYDRTLTILAIFMSRMLSILTR